MSISVRFLYDAPEHSEFEEPNTSFQGGDGLFDFEAEVLAETEVQITSFVLEHRREQRTTELRWCEKYGVWDLEDVQNLEDPSVCAEAIWFGPSSPFPPEQAREWAHRWICLLRELPAETRRLVCSDFLLDILNADLRALIRQADCADRHSLQMRFDLG